MKNINILLLITILYLLIGSIAGSAASVTVKLDNIKADSGNVVDIPINVEGAPNIGAIQFALTYDASILEAKEVVKGSMLTDNSLLEFTTGCNPTKVQNRQ